MDSGISTVVCGLICVACGVVLSVLLQELWNQIRYRDYFGDDLMSWEEFKDGRFDNNSTSTTYKILDVACPVCGNRIQKNTAFVLTTFPEQYRYECTCCDWNATYY